MCTSCNTLVKTHSSKGFSENNIFGQCVWYQFYPSYLDIVSDQSLAEFSDLGSYCLLFGVDFRNSGDDGVGELGGHGGLPPGQGIAAIVHSKVFFRNQKLAALIHSNGASNSARQKFFFNSTTTTTAKTSLYIPKDAALKAFCSATLFFRAVREKAEVQQNQLCCTCSKTCRTASIGAREQHDSKGNRLKPGEKLIVWLPIICTYSDLLVWQQHTAAAFIYLLYAHAHRAKDAKPHNTISTALSCSFGNWRASEWAACTRGAMHGPDLQQQWGQWGFFSSFPSKNCQWGKPCRTWHSWRCPQLML